MERKLRQRLPSGTFVNVPAVRSRTMAAIRGRNNRSTERKLRSALVRAGIRGWIINDRAYPGTPDFMFRSLKVAIFVDGCFWHGCKNCANTPNTNARYWRTKISLNKQRDRRSTYRLRARGILVLRFWEHELLHMTQCLEKTNRCLLRATKKRYRG